MKKIKFIYISATVLALFLSACNKQLNIKPVESVDQNQAIKTAKDVQGVLEALITGWGRLTFMAAVYLWSPIC